jgi:hypothetical protein
VEPRHHRLPVAVSLSYSQLPSIRKMRADYVMELLWLFPLEATQVVRVLDTESPIPTFLFYTVVGWRQGRALGNEEGKAFHCFVFAAAENIWTFLLTLYLDGCIMTKSWKSSGCCLLAEIWNVIFGRLHEVPSAKFGICVFAFLTLQRNERLVDGTTGYQVLCKSASKC